MIKAFGNNHLAMHFAIIRLLGLLALGFCFAPTTLWAQRQGNIDSFTLPVDRPEEGAPATLSLDMYAEKKAVVVIFTSEYCTWSTKYVDRISELDATYRDQGIQFLAINSNDATFEPVVRTDPGDTPFEFPSLIDSAQVVAQQFGATKNPEVFVLQPANNHFKIVYHGKIDDNPLDEDQVRHNYLADALDALLTGERIEVKETPVSGCSIKGG